MKAMILAAGRGERMRPLTDHIPKPLLEIDGKALIEHHIDALYKAGFRELVINLGHLGRQIETALGDGKNYGVSIEYSREPEDALETGGGILQALPLLGIKPFLVTNSDTWTDYPFAKLLNFEPENLAHLILVDNPEHVPTGDFSLKNGQVSNTGGNMLSFSGIYVLRSELFAHCRPGRFSITPLLRNACTEYKVSGEYYSGTWVDIGTPQRLALLNRQKKNSSPWE